MQNKATLCKSKGALSFMTSLVSLEDPKQESLVELGVNLIKSVLTYCAMNDSCLSELRSLHFYTILLEHSLKSSNLSIVANACCILWSMSRCKSEQKLLWNLGADVHLKALCDSSHKLIALTAKAALKNLYSSTAHSPVFFSTGDEAWANSGQSLSSSMCSSVSANSILSNRNRKQTTEKSREFFDKVNKCSLPSRFDTLSIDDFPSISSSSTASNSSISSTESSSSSNSSTSNSECSSDSINSITKGSYYLNSSFKTNTNKNIYYLNECSSAENTDEDEDCGKQEEANTYPELLPAPCLINESPASKKSNIKTKASENVPVKRVTFSSKDNVFFNYDPCDSHIRPQEDEQNVVVIDAKNLEASNQISTKLVVDSTFKPSSQSLKYNSKHVNTDSARSNSPVTNFRFIKSNSSLLAASPQVDTAETTLNVSEWPSIVDIQQATKLKCGPNSSSKPKRLVGLVRPFVPVSGIKHELHNNKNRLLNPRIQASVLIKRNSFIIEDQEKRNKLNTHQIRV